MNMLQRNPRDPKHREFHDGEYEYWPVKAPVSGKNISFPAACLIAALAAAALLAAALTMLYSLTSPKAIYKDFAIVNVNIYNNVDNLDIRYTLSPKSDPNTVIQEGMLEYSEHTLNLRGLTPGTQYILQYTSLKDGVWEPIGDFEFRTPGDPPEQFEPSLTTPTEPASGSEPTNQAEGATDATEATTKTEETTEPDEPPAIWYPPTPDPTPNPAPNPTPNPTPDPAPDPTPDPTPEPEEPAGPAPLDPEIRVEYSYTPTVDQSGIEYVYYSVQQTHSFQNIPNGAYTVRINGEEIAPPPPIENGILSVTDTKLLAIGEASTTTVTVVLDDGTLVDSTLEIVTPSMESVSLDVTPIDEENCIFTITVTTNNTGYNLAFDTELNLPPYDDPIKVRMEGPVNGVYTGTYTVAIDPADAEDAYVYVAAIWDMAGTPEDVSLAQSEIAYAKLNP